jgi:hypothetical protein
MNSPQPLPQEGRAIAIKVPPSLLREGGRGHSRQLKELNIVKYGENLVQNRM